MSRLSQRLRPRCSGALLAGLALLVVGLGTTAVSAEIYRYVDAQGREQFTTDLSRVPARQREAAQADAAGRKQLNRSEAASSGSQRARPRAGDPDSPYLYRAPAASAPAAAPPVAKRKPWQIEDPRPGGMPETSWRREHDRILSRIEMLEQQRGELESAGGDHAPPTRRGKISKSRYAQYKAKHEAWRKAGRELDLARRSLDRFEERARKAGVPPGWLR